jgi:hypothetical protein
MRTTLVINDEIYKKIKSKAALEGRKVTELIEEGLILRLNEDLQIKKSQKKKKSPTLPIMDRSNGITLFQGKTTLEYIEHLKNLEIYGK